MSTTTPNYADWIVGDARADASRRELEIAIENLPDKETDPTAVEAATIKQNSPSSEPGSPIWPGGIVNVIIFPLEGRKD
ncbi:MAG: hypothetical protein KDE27_29940 [Planctomycetes bacterium]|nr:hypothetical protein [Planctomycetota bacterium]